MFALVAALSISWFCDDLRPKSLGNPQTLATKKLSMEQKQLGSGLPMGLQRWACINETFGRFLRLSRNWNLFGALSDVFSTLES